MRQTVTVLSVQGDSATVSYDRPTACHMDCDHCAGGCASMTAKEQIVVRADNPIGASAGDRVVVESSSRSVYGAIALVYAVPLVLFFLGYFSCEGLGYHPVVGGIGGFLLGVLCAVLVSRRKTHTGNEIHFEIVGYADEDIR